MRHKIERVDKYNVKRVDIMPGDVIEVDDKLFIAKCGGPCALCAFDDQTGGCLVNIYGGSGDKICKPGPGRLTFKELDTVLEDL